MPTWWLAVVYIPLRVELLSRRLIIDPAVTKPQSQKSRFQAVKVMLVMQNLYVTFTEIHLLHAASLHLSGWHTAIPCPTQPSTPPGVLLVNISSTFSNIRRWSSHFCTPGGFSIEKTPARVLQGFPAQQYIQW